MRIETISAAPGLAAFFPMVEGVVRLFYPFVEGAVHDLEQGKIIALFNNFSKRKAGDPSPLNELQTETAGFPDVFEPYMKTNWDGRRLKCVSMTIRGKDGKPAGLVCLNFDISVFDGFDQVMHQLRNVSPASGNPVELFDDSWEDKVQDFIRNYLNEHGLVREKMGSAEKQSLVRLLYEKGYLNYKYAAKVVAGLLGVSRATVYNYLKQDI